MTSSYLTPKVFLGEYKGDHSLVVYSSKGVDWYNVHPNLEKVLKSIYADDILDLSLGCDGRFYIKYSSGLTVEQRLTQGIWEEIQPQLQGRLRRVSKLSLGFGDEIWAVSGEQEARHFLRARDRVLEIVQPSDSPHPAVNDIEFIAFGCCKDDFIIKIKGEVSVGNWESPSMSGIRPAQVNQIVAAALSPVDDSHYFILFNDGSYRAELHRVLKKIVKRHMKTMTSLLYNEREETVETRVEPVPNPFDGLLMGPIFMTPALSSSSSTELKLLDFQDSSYWRIRQLFENGWMHPWKMRPEIQHIYEIQLPEHLARSYLNYR
ncbi:hypothetical protein FRC04_011836 [Tulasnella sp. 424]|nr:hypothetical protein FRC04_011836 [Tulasnella sp. 424]